MNECEVYDSIDFGRGPVEVRCTQIGEHTQHVCKVLMGGVPKIQHQNIFEKED